MKGSLDNHLSKLYVYPSRNAFVLSGETDMRACCKSMRERLRRLLPTVEYHAVWLRIDNGVLLFVAGPSILERILSSMFQESEHLYSGTGRQVIRDFVHLALETQYVPVVGLRRYGASRS
ncbi:putative GGDEF_2 domain-containing protein [Pseudomonas sp. IT-P218]